MMRLHGQWNGTIAHPPGWSSQAGPPPAKPVQPREFPRSGRLVGLDAAKGSLILVMVFYHWMNYFVGLHSEVYRYIRFVTPSFIFLSGFLISHVYLPRMAAGERGIPGRLFLRGLKLLGIVLVLNGVARVFGVTTVASRFGRSEVVDLWAHLSGLSPVAFSVLIPIAYLLLVSAGLLRTSKVFGMGFHFFSAVCFGAALWGEWSGRPTGYLDLLSMGLVGASIGHVAITTLDRIVRQRAAILTAYAAYVYALTLWNTLLVLQFVGVCLNILVLYWLGTEPASGRWERRMLVRLGEYSLLAYIGQIVILQVARVGTRMAGVEHPATGIALLACALGVILLVEAVDRAKRYTPAFARLYRAVFA